MLVSAVKPEILRRCSSLSMLSHACSRTCLPADLICSRWFTICIKPSSSTFLPNIHHTWVGVQVMGVLDAMPSTNLKPENDEEVLEEDRVYRTTYMFSATMPQAPALPGHPNCSRSHLPGPHVCFSQIPPCPSRGKTQDGDGLLGSANQPIPLESGMQGLGLQMCMIMHVPAGLIAAHGLLFSRQSLEVSTVGTASGVST